MTGMMDAIIGALLGLSGRERLLVAVLALVALPLGVVYGVALPLADARQEAQRAVAEARATELWVADQSLLYASETTALRNAGEGANGGPPIGISGIEASLVEAGLRAQASELANAADGGITMRFDAVRFTKLAEWLTLQEANWGYTLVGFTFERGEREDVVAADLRLVIAQ
ncbi:Type II secretory pathway, component PulM [Roseovarius marisflavi]|uniref:Type II secretory pathway, component PulM n=1 Tax=Roseovarius marisflavi TaxID=1054996 RepID=A0A1M6YPA6_9RHOB|nr:type II secretion system protein GspM [Roseovarius marisflavi]SHL20161.1 Type II secretory pathway, component PulM [Roseovarius marisflavi]